jgi:hypothetical protein
MQQTYFKESIMTRQKKQESVSAVSPELAKMKATVELNRDQFDRFRTAVFAVEGVKILLSETSGGQAYACSNLLTPVFDSLMGLYNELDERFCEVDALIEKAS